MIHIVFQENDVSTLEKAIQLDETLRGNVIQVKDDFAVGPILDIFSETGIEARKQWWRKVLAGGDYDGLVDNGEIDDNKTVSELAKGLNKNPEQIIWIWVAPNKHDVSGYYWLITQLKNFQSKIF